MKHSVTKLAASFALLLSFLPAGASAQAVDWYSYWNACRYYADIGDAANYLNLRCNDVFGAYNGFSTYYMSYPGDVFFNRYNWGTYYPLFRGNYYRFRRGGDFDHDHGGFDHGHGGFDHGHGMDHGHGGNWGGGTGGHGRH